MGNEQSEFLWDRGSTPKNSSGAIKGEHYKPSGDCNECCVPWEVCGWPCPDAITDKGNDQR